MHAIVIFIYLTLGTVSVSFAQNLTIPDNPLKGRIVFEQKGCISCHAIQGDGKEIGPDLGEQKIYGSFLQLAGIMWNHAPEMLRKMNEQNMPFPEFTQTEMVELIAYLYYLRYLGEPGEPEQGKILIKEKACLNCHSIGVKGGDLAPAFEKFAKFVAPLYIAQALWNHGPKMDKQLKKKGLKRPHFAEGELVDLAAYIREASSGAGRGKASLSPGNPNNGKNVFEEKGCINCHDLDDRKNNIIPDLEEVDLALSVTGIAGLMWNHGAEMQKQMKEEEIEWPQFEAKEMADLTAFLYFLKFNGKAGNKRAGKAVFSEKGCISCHSTDVTGGTIGPNLTKSKHFSSTIDMAHVMWNHAQVMEKRIAEKVQHWPIFTGNEITDLYAYLKSISQGRDK